ncbi:MAG: MEMAR_RS02690 family S-layer glycoprotein [Methanomicrobiales archaeon]
MKSTMKFMVAALVVVALLAVPAMARTPDVNTLVAGDVAFVYETNLNVPAVGGGTVAVAKFGNDCPVSGAGCTFTGELARITLNPAGKLDINTAPPYFGTWFPIDATGNGALGNSFQIQHADIQLDAVLNASHIDTISGKSVTRDTNMSFKLITNYAGNYYKVGSTYLAKVNIELTTPGGGKIMIFGNNAVDLRAITLNGSVEYTDTLPAGSQAAGVGNAIDLTNMEAGTYTATAKWTSTMPWFQLESNSNAVTFTVLSKPITVTTNKESVVRGNTFVVTITGESKHLYYVYMKDAAVTSGYIYPQITNGQSNVFLTALKINNCAIAGCTAVANDVNTLYGTVVANNATGAVVNTSADGTRAIQFQTSSQASLLTYDTKYTIKVMDSQDATKYDTVDVNVAKGQVTITYEGTGTYYLGETIKLTGTNTDSNAVFLFLVGPNLATNGVNLADISQKTQDTVEGSFKKVDVNTDNTWSFKWDTSALTKTLDAGTYTIYAAAQAHTKDNLTNTQYSTASVVLKKPFVTASASSNTLAQGDILYIQGTAEGKPNNVYIWIFGKNYRDCQVSATVQSDASYSYKLDRGATHDLFAGQYFAVVQHPMMNGIADILGDPTGTGCLNATGTTNPVKGTWVGGAPTVRLVGLQASDAATALVDLLNSPNVDDTYTKLSFMVEAPWIRIDTISDHYVGDTFTITGTTNLAEGDQILMTVVSSSFQPTEKTQTGEFSGTSGTVTVQKGDTYNTFSFDVDASTFKPDEYLVTAESIEPSQTVTATFNVLEGQPTTAVTTAPPTQATTAPVTTAPTQVATTVATTAPAQPGFGALVALVGLGAVALLVLRRR